MSIQTDFRRASPDPESSESASLDASRKGLGETFRLTLPMWAIRSFLAVVRPFRRCLIHSLPVWFPQARITPACLGLMVHVSSVSKSTVSPSAVGSSAAPRGVLAEDAGGDNWTLPYTLVLKELRPARDGDPIAPQAPLMFQALRPYVCIHLLAVSASCRIAGWACARLVQ